MADFRMPDVNKLFLAGRLTRDPELRYTPQGMALCKMGLAASRFYKGRDGERKEETVFVEVTAWDKSAEYVGERLKQGAPLLIEGRLRTDSWEDKQTGQRRSKLEVTAVRVQELSWSTDRAPAQQAAGQESRAPIHDEPIPEGAIS